LLVFWGGLYLRSVDYVKIEDSNQKLMNELKKELRLGIERENNIEKENE
jgi:hypothetical protein